MSGDPHTAGGDGTVADLVQLERDPYPTYAALQEKGGLTWMEPVGMWWATRYDDVRAILLDDVNFTTASPESPILDAFGPQVLSTDGDEHRRYRTATQGAFSPRAVREAHEAHVDRIVSDLIDEIPGCEMVELRSAFASKLPVRLMLAAAGWAQEHEAAVRRWYDIFEQRLADVSGDTVLRTDARQTARAFKAVAGAGIATADSQGAVLLEVVREAVNTGAITLDEAERNLLIIFFGGISTIEAIILNTLWALYCHPRVLAAVRFDATLIPAAVEETMRWLSPVQSITRFVVSEMEFAGTQLKAGQKVAGMIAAANRDPSVFSQPHQFILGRENVRKHLGFATGPHVCMGLHLARVEAARAIAALFESFPNLAFDTATTSPEGFEFRQPRELWVRPTG